MRPPACHAPNFSILSVRYDLYCQVAALTAAGLACFRFQLCINVYINTHVYVFTYLSVYLYIYIYLAMYLSISSYLSIYICDPEPCTLNQRSPL